MAELSTEDRQRIWRGLQRYWSQVWESVDVSSAALLTTVQETDGWIDDNQAGYNAVLTYADSFTVSQKTLIFCCVALARTDPGVAALLQRALGVEVD